MEQARAAAEAKVDELSAEMATLKANQTTATDDSRQQMADLEGEYMEMAWRACGIGLDRQLTTCSSPARLEEKNKALQGALETVQQLQSEYESAMSDNETTLAQVEVSEGSVEVDIIPGTSPISTSLLSYLLDPSERTAAAVGRVLPAERGHAGRAG